MQKALARGGLSKRSTEESRRRMNVVGGSGRAFCWDCRTQHAIFEKHIRQEPTGVMIADYNDRLLYGHEPTVQIPTG